MSKIKIYSIASRKKYDANLNLTTILLVIITFIMSFGITNIFI